MSDLLKINVNEHTEQKNGLTYLSWAWAWAEVLKVDPLATWEAHEFMRPCPGSNMSIVAPCMYMPDESAMVKVTVTIKGNKRSCLLPVMNHKNQAIKNPDAFAINTAIVRCLTKAISMHGLGLYIYAGEDLPQVESDEAAAEREKREQRGSELDRLADELIEYHHNGKDLLAIKRWYAEDTWAKDSSERNDEITYVWGLLREHSKLRSTIKANKPQEQPA